MLRITVLYYCFYYEYKQLTDRWQSELLQAFDKHEEGTRLCKYN